MTHPTTTQPNIEDFFQVLGNSVRKRLTVINVMFFYLEVWLLKPQTILKSVLCSKIEIKDGKEIRTLMPKA